MVIESERSLGKSLVRGLSRRVYIRMNSKRGAQMLKQLEQYRRSASQAASGLNFPIILDFFGWADRIQTLQ